MVLDKLEIKRILCKDMNEFEARKDKEDVICIQTADGESDFDVNTQLGCDSIDLRIADYAYVMNDNYEYINTLADQKFDDFFKRIVLERDGYILKPGQLVFVPTLERIAISGSIIGRITGRSVFARMGLSVHCTQDKFASGINSVVGLQIINNSPVGLKIFPKQKLAQLLIEKTFNTSTPYNGNYRNEEKYTLPFVNASDRAQYDETDRHAINLHKYKKKSVIKNQNKPYLTSIYKTIIASGLAVAMAVFGSLEFDGSICCLIICGVLEVASMIAFTHIELEMNKKRQ